MSERAAALVVEARTHTLARWCAMLSSVRRGVGYGGRFTGGPLLEAVEPLLALSAVPPPPPKGKERPPARRGKAAKESARGRRGRGSWKEVHAARRKRIKMVRRRKG